MVEHVVVVVVVVVAVVVRTVQQWSEQYIPPAPIPALRPKRY